jgi:hypothetical protein
MSGGLKREIRSRYIEYVVLYTIFSWPICLVTFPFYNYFTFLNSFIAGTLYVQTKFSAIVLLGGFLIAVSRMRDRLLRQKLSNMFKCVKSSITNTEIQDTNLNTFLTTSLNTELVVTILKGITILAAGSTDNTDNLIESDMLKIK